MRKDGGKSKECVILKENFEEFDTIFKILIQNFFKNEIPD